MRHPDDRGAAYPTEGGHPDEGTIHAWLDDQLPEAEAESLGRHVEGCAECGAAVAEARGLVAASRRILHALDEGPGGVHAHHAGRTPSPRSGANAAPTGDGGSGASSATKVAPEDAGMDDLSRRRLGQPARRRWRMPAVAAAAAMAAVTTIVVQRSGPPPSLVNEQLESMKSVAAPVVPPPQPTAVADEVASAEPTPEVADVAPQATIGPDRSTNMERALAVRQQSATGATVGGAAAKSAAPVEDPELRSAPPIVQPPPEVVVAESVPAPAPSVAPTAAPRSVAVRAAAGATAELLPMQPRLSFRADADANAGDLAVAGRVLAPDGEPVAEARVSLPEIGRGATTDSVGNFRLTGMPAGDHWLLVQKAGFDDRRVFLRLPVDEDSVVTVALGPAREGAVDTTSGDQGLPVPVPVAVPPVAPGVLAEWSARLAGCYRMELGGATSEGRELAEEALPGWVHLRTIPSGTDGWLVADPMVSSGDSEESGQARWQAADSGEAEIAWPTSVAATEVVLRLRGTGEVLTGTAALRSTAADGSEQDEEEVASVVFVRSVCSE